jgi:hypothetical protein
VLDALMADGLPLKLAVVVVQLPRPSFSEHELRHQDNAVSNSSGGPQVEVLLLPSAKWRLTIADTLATGGVCVMHAIHSNDEQCLGSSPSQFVIIEHDLR